MSSSKISANTLSLIKEAQQQSLKAKLARITGATVSTSKTSIETPKSPVIHEVFKTVINPPYETSWEEGNVSSSDSDGNFVVNVDAEGSVEAAAAGIIATYVPPVDGRPVSFLVTATYVFDWLVGPGTGITLCELGYGVYLNGTGSLVLSGTETIWDATSGQAAQPNVQYTLPITGSFIGTNAEYAITVGFNVFAQGNAKGNINGKITNLTLYIENTGN